MQADYIITHKINQRGLYKSNIVHGHAAAELDLAENRYIINMRNYA